VKTDRMVNSSSALGRLPVLTVRAGPLDPEWEKRLEEELVSLVTLVELNADTGNEWFSIEPTDERGIDWTGTCWTVYEHKRYEFKVHFEIPATYPSAPIEIELPELDGKSAKMYRGGKICLDLHFAPLWRTNTPNYGIVHAMCLALGPWLSAEIPYLVESGVISR
jgi:ufm1-conjugating enzyme 1